MNEEKLLISIRDAAKMIDIAPSTFRNWLSEKVVIPHEVVRKLGRRTTIHKSSFIEWINNEYSKENDVNKETNKYE